MVSSESINGNIDMIENEITPKTLDSIIIEPINIIRCNKKRAQRTTYLNISTKNCITQVLLPLLY